MSLSEFTGQQLNGDLDLYDDILREDFECEKDSINELQQKYQEALQKISTLENTVKSCTSAMELLEKKNANLQSNILNLYKTACLTIEEKSGDIISLRKQIEFYEKERCSKQRQSGYSHWNSHHQRHNPSPRDQRDTKENDRRHSRHSDVKNPRYFDSKPNSQHSSSKESNSQHSSSKESNSQHSSSKERRHDDRRYEEKHSSHRDLQKLETKDDGSLERTSSRHSKTRNNYSDTKMENSSREHKRSNSKHCYQKTPSSIQNLSSRSENRKSHTTPLREKHNFSNNSSESGNAKKQDSKLIGCQQSVEPISIVTQLSVKSAGSDAERSKSSTRKFCPSDKHRSKMRDPVVTLPEPTTKCDRNDSPVISPKYKTSKVFNSSEPIVIKCFGISNLEDSHSPIIIPCFPSSATNSRTHDSMSSEDSDGDKAVPRNKTIVRKLFSPSKTERNLSVENLVSDNKLAENHSLEFLNEMKKKLSQEIAAHNRRQQDEDCEDTTQLVDIYQTHEEEEYCSNDSLREDQNSVKTFSPQPQSDLHAGTERSETECVDIEDGEILSDNDNGNDKKKEQTSSRKTSSSEKRVSSNSKKHLSKHESKHSSRRHSKKRKFSGDETLTKIKDKHRDSSSRTENKRREIQ